MVYEGRFRASLYFRLRIVEVRVPPLRERGDHILLRARHFLALHGARDRKPGLYVTPQAEAALRSHAWPGKGRELRSIMEQALLVTEGTAVSAQLLRLASPLSLTPAGPGLPDGDINLERMDRLFIKQVLERSGHNVSAAARLLGISRDTLRYRLERLEECRAHK